jgi:ABC-type Fe2+-enterobactin transport system substrate-binding protein
MADTLKVGIKEELRFLQEFDAALAAVRRVVDMPQRRATLLVKLMWQNEGRLSQSKRGQFLELSNEEVAALENAVAASCPPEQNDSVLG